MYKWKRPFLLESNHQILFGQSVFRYRRDIFKGLPWRKIWRSFILLWHFFGNLICVFDKCHKVKFCIVLHFRIVLWIKFSMSIAWRKTVIQFVCWCVSQLMKMLETSCSIGALPICSKSSNLTMIQKSWVKVNWAEWHVLVHLFFSSKVILRVYLELNLLFLHILGE